MKSAQPAWSWRARDVLIGWDAATRQTQRSRVVCDSRFLIVPTVRVPHLAAHAPSVGEPPEIEPSLREATRMVAALGSFLRRKGDGGT